MKRIKRIFIISAMVLSTVSVLGQGAFAASLKASTSLTIVNVTDFQANSVDITKWDGDWPRTPDAVAPTGLEVYLNQVYFTQFTLRWNTVPYLTPYVPFANGINSIVAAVWSNDQGKTFKLISWDFLVPDTHFKVAEEGMHDCWMGTLVHSICDRSPAECNDRKRSNLYFTEYPSGTVGCWASAIMK